MSYRFLEILPGAISWTTIILMVVFSWLLPVYTAFFIILFDIYWLFKTVYLSLHLRATFSKMKKNLKIDWLKKLRASGLEFQDIYHLIILPMYKEPYEVVKESFDALVNSNYSKDKFVVVLATEEKAREAGQVVAKKIEEEFGNKFFRFLATVHPAGLLGEIPGKGSNETWAAKEVKGRVIDQLTSARVLVSVFDVDTQVPPDYFARLTYAFLNSENPERSSFQPIPFFTNNIFQAPALARVIAFSATFWHMMQQSRPERLTTFSSHSMPFRALVQIGFWNTGVVSEDSQIFWQCFLYFSGDWRVEPLFCPVSMDANIALTFWQTMINLYKQQRRWAWGCENIPYMFWGFLKNKKIKLQKKWYWGFNILESFHSWATNALIIFALGWLPVLIGRANFNKMVLSYNLPYITRWIMTLAMIGIISSAILSIILLPPKPKWFKFRHYFLYFFQWILMPLTLIVFGAIPALEAQTRLMLGGKFRLGFWVTPKQRG